MFHYDEVGHYVRDYSKYKGKWVKVESTDDGNIVTTANNSFSNTYDVLAITMSSSGDDWLLDSKCSYHVTSHSH